MVRRASAPGAARPYPACRSSIAFRSVRPAAPNAANIADGGVDAAASNAANIADGSVPAAAGLPGKRNPYSRVSRPPAGAR